MVREGAYGELSFLAWTEMCEGDGDEEKHGTPEL